MRGVDGGAPTVTGTVGNGGNQGEARLRGERADLAVEQVADRMHDVDVAPLGLAGNAVGLARFSRVADGGERARVVLDEQPVAHVLAGTVNGKTFALPGAQDHQRDQL